MLDVGARAPSVENEDASTFFLERGENQQRQKPIIVIGPDEGNTTKTRGKDWR